MGEIWSIVGFCLLLTAVLAFVEIAMAANLTSRMLTSVLSPHFFVYSVVLLIGNCIGGLLAPGVADAAHLVPSSAAPFFFAVFGVFAFRGIVSNLNVTFLSKGFTFDDWVKKARDIAVADALA